MWFQLRSFLTGKTLALCACTLAISTSYGRADDGDYEYPAPAATTDLGNSGNVVIDAGDSVGTITGSNLRGAAAFQEGVGRRAYFESLSAINLQRAIDANLSNRRQSLESYYEMKELRDSVVANEDTITHQEAVELAKQKAPDRLTPEEYDPQSGRIFWPRPLDAEALQPYTKVIDASFAKRSNSGGQYSGFDARRVERMIRLLQEAVDSVKKELPVKEYIAISDYLARISYEASFDLEGNRIQDR